MRLFLFSLLAVLLTACVAPSERGGNTPKPAGPAAEYEPIHFKGQYATAEERARCEAAGGTVTRGGLRGWDICSRRLPDAGKVCWDSDDCLGLCQATGEQEMGEPATGTCQVMDPTFGCLPLIEDGRVGPTLCID